MDGVVVVVGVVVVRDVVEGCLKGGGSGSGFGERMCGVREVVRVRDGDAESIGNARKSITFGFNLEIGEDVVVVVIFLIIPNYLNEALQHQTYSLCLFDHSRI